MRADYGRSNGANNQKDLTRIVICDNHAVVLQGVSSYVAGQRGFEVVGEATDGGEAIELVRKLAPNVLVLDLMMSGVSGFDVLETLHQEGSETRVLVLTSYAEEHHVLRALRLGATGYITKDAGQRLIVEAIHDVAGGKQYLEQAIMPTVMRFLRDEDSSSPLTDREVQLLPLIREGCTNRQIAGELKLAESTVKTYLTALFSKLGVTNRTGAINEALRRGLI